VSLKLKTIIIIIGLVLSLIGLTLIYQDFKTNQVRLLPISLFVIGVFSSYKVLAKTNHKSRRFKLKKFEEDED